MSKKTNATWEAEPANGLVEGMAQIANLWDRFHSMHPVKVVVNAGGSITTIDYDGTRMSAGEPADRGVRIELHFDSEWGKTLVMAFQFHKGQTRVTGDVSELSPEEDGSPAVRPTIWRD
jgi:hypothetical protein